MKGDRLGEFEEFTLLAVRALERTPYSVPVQQYLEKTTGRRVSLGAVYSALGRLEQKGLIRSALGEPTSERGGKRKRELAVTAAGMRTLRELRTVREQIWRALDARHRS
ncbi:MAG: PadR family transcriptional regulator [Acidobacteriota bacterium]|jgi:PadR family transcriptional regulator PadR